MSIKTFFRKSIKSSKSQYIHPNQIIKLRMEQEGKFIKAFSEMIQNPKLNITTGIKDKNKLFLSQELDSFRQTIYNINQKNLKIKDESKHFNEKEKSFIEKYKIFKKFSNKKFLNDTKVLHELRYKIIAKNNKAPSFNPNKNLFNKNLLLEKNENIGDFLSYKVGTLKGNCKAFKYLDKLNQTVSEKMKYNINIARFYEHEGIAINNKNNKKINNKYMNF